MRELARIICLCLGLSPIFAHAQIVLEDPKQLLVQLDQFVGPSSFADLQCGQEAIYQNYIDECSFQCEQGSCSSFCGGQHRNVIKTLASCELDGVSIYGDDGSILDIRADDWVSAKGNLLRLFLAQQLFELLRSPGTLTLQTLEPFDFRINPKNLEEPVYKTQNLHGVFVPAASNYQVPVVLTVAQGVAPMAQIFRFRVLDSTWFRIQKLPEAQ